jgi:sugar phosphate isomerase/epimerase
MGSTRRSPGRRSAAVLETDPGRVHRRGFLAATAALSLAAAVGAPRRAAASASGGAQEAQDEAAGERRKLPRFGLVTYLWGRDWDLPTLLANCERTGLLGVELRTTHAHGVEPDISAEARREVKKRFADSPVTLLGPGSNERFDAPDPQVVAKAVEATKRFLQLSHDVGGSGVKVKPDRFHDGVPREKTIAQIGAALGRLGPVAADLGQEVRLEVHGQCSELPVIAKIVAAAEHPSVRVCWNSNAADLEGDGLAANFKLVRDRFGRTAHVHELDRGSYPYAELFTLLVETSYDGWVLLEASSDPRDRVAALERQRELFEALLARAREQVRSGGAG